MHNLGLTLARRAMQDVSPHGVQIVKNGRKGRGRASPYSKSPQRRRAWLLRMRVKTTCSLAPTPQKGRERDGKRATTERRAVLSSDCEIVCGGAVGRSDQILEYIARSIEEETDGKEFAGWGD